MVSERTFITYHSAISYFSNSDSERSLEQLYFRFQNFGGGGGLERIWNMYDVLWISVSISGTVSYNKIH